MTPSTQRPFYLCHTYFQTYSALVLSYHDSRMGQSPIIALAFTRNRLNDEFLREVTALPWVTVQNLTNKAAFERISTLDPIRKLMLNYRLCQLYPRYDRNAAALPEPGSVSVFLFSDFHYIARYIKRRHGSGITLVEEGLMTYQKLRLRPKLFIKWLLGVRPTFGRDPRITRILVNRPDKLPPDTRRKGAPLAFEEKVKALPSDIRQRIAATFLGGRRYGLLPHAVLLLTQPSYDFKRLNREQHIAVYGEIVRTLDEKGYEVHIKPHPSDSIPYAEQNLPAHILGADFPIEVLNGSIDEPIAWVIGVNTSAVYNVQFAREALNLLPDDRWIGDDFDGSLRLIRAALARIPQHLPNAGGQP